MSDPQVRLPSIDGLRAFEAAARLGSFERAAVELHLTASAVSKRVATLEDLLGAQLFARGAKALALTPLGSEYLSQVGAALDMLAAVPLHRRTSQRTRRLRIAVPPTFARQVLVPALDDFSRAEPDIELEIVLSIPHLDTAGADADVQVRYAATRTDEAHHVLLRDRVIPMLAPALRARLPAQATPADLLALTLLRTPLQPWAPWFAAAGMARDEPDGGPRLLDLGMTLEAAVAGQGVALGRPSLARHWLESGALLAPVPIAAEPSHQYHVPIAAGSEAAAAFTRWLGGVCADAQAWADDWLSRAG